MKLKEIQVIDEETYLATNGAGRQEIGEAALHKNIPEGRIRQRLVDCQAEKDREILRKRNELRQEYKARVDAGEIRAHTRLERLISTAHGHSDLESTKAARRLLKKKGIDVSDFLK